ncbi:MAG: hypothetical protein D8M59_04325 [Planctomycetes bacterium]|nr:hypothetical protein [Planctomycetota bacterium]NOG55734.1 TonB-dependent receptor [Planctomycetota bacterium]
MMANAKTQGRPMCRGVLCTLTSLCLAATTLGQQDEDEIVHPDTVDWSTEDEDLLNMSIEELMDIEVISVSRDQGQSLFRAPAAIFVIGPDDIRHTGHSTIPELLRLVPGMYVARIDSNKWAVSARGFNGRFNKYQLVQLDGRTLYTPGFSGVIWSVQDTMLEDIEQIEVIRGPGATLWGANAMNGIINITTLPASETQGLLWTTSTGDNTDSTLALRYGGTVSDSGHFRVYGKFSEFAKFRPAGPAYTDDWRRAQGGFRFDWGGTDDDDFTLQGDVYSAHVGESIKYVDVDAGTVSDIDGTHDFVGWNVLGRWTHRISEDSTVQVQGYFDWANWHIPYPDMQHAHQTIATVDLDFQHTLSAFDRHALVWGGNFRFVSSDYHNGGVVQFEDTNRQITTVSGFIQDTMTIVPDRLDVVLGTKIEHNEFTFFEFQPNARVLWTPDERQTIWASVSRAVRIPSYVEDHGGVTLSAAGPGMPVRLIANRDLEPDELIAYEVGYRIRPTDRIAFDVTAYANDLDKITDVESVSLLDLQVTNTQDGEAYGFEGSATWEVEDNWTLSGTYSFEQMYLHGRDETKESDLAHHMFSIRSSLDLTEDVSLDAAWYYTDSNGYENTAAHHRLDVGVLWTPRHNMEVRVWGQNLLDGHTREYSEDNYLSRGYSETERSVRAQVNIKF